MAQNAHLRKNSTNADIVKLKHSTDIIVQRSSQGAC